jgi:hypothetical protein
MYANGEVLVRYNGNCNADRYFFTTGTGFVWQAIDCSNAILVVLR